HGARRSPRDVCHDLELLCTGQCGKQVRLLEHDADPVPPQCRGLAVAQHRRVHPANDHPPLFGADQRGSHRQQTGFTGAGRTNHRGQRTRRYRQLHIVQRGQPAVPVRVGQRHVLQSQQLVRTHRNSNQWDPGGPGGLPAHRALPSAVSGSTAVIFRIASPAPAAPSAIMTIPGITVVEMSNTKGTVPAASAPTPAASPAPTAVPATRINTACPSASRSRYPVEAPSAFNTAMSAERWIVHTVKNAPITNAEIANRKPRINRSDEFSALNDPIALTASSTDTVRVPSCSSAAARSASSVARSASTVAVPGSAPVTR